MLNSKFDNPVWHTTSSDLDSQRQYSEALTENYSFKNGAASPKNTKEETGTLGECRESEDDGANTVAGL